MARLFPNSSSGRREAANRKSSFVARLFCRGWEMVFWPLVVLQVRRDAKPLTVLPLGQAWRRGGSLAVHARGPPCVWPLNRRHLHRYYFVTVLIILLSDFQICIN